jgi:hypothetical protein
MPSVRCPSCGRAIPVAEHLRGTWVMCPDCYTSVEVLGDPVPLQPPGGTPGPPGPAPAEDLIFEDTPAQRRAAGAPARALQGAANWLMLAVALDGLCALAWGLLGATRADNWNALASVLLVAVLAELAPLMLVALGAVQMMARGSLGLAVVGGVVAPLVSCWFVFRAGVIALAGWESLEGSGIIGGLLLGLALFALAGALCGFVGGIRTLMALTNRGVRHLFDRAHGG